jgi:hypothetical protein
MRHDDVAQRRRARRALRWYPRQWRDRYGDEFVELLLAEYEERPFAPARLANVVVSGVTARLSAAGLAGGALGDLDPAERARRSLVTLGCSLAVFVSVALALWAQLTIGWQWAAPATGATWSAMFAMTVGALALGALCLAAAGPVLWAVAVRLVRRHGQGLVGPTLVVVAGVVFLAAGAHHFANGWPGTRGHPWAHQGLVPGGLAAFAWASTLSVTSYWVHPTALGAFPGPELAWMLVSPVVMVLVVVAGAKVTRRVELPARALRFEQRVGQLAALAMAVFVTGAALWVVDGGPGPRNLFHVGAIDVAELLVLLGALALAAQAVHTGRRGSPSLAAR